MVSHCAPATGELRSVSLDFRDCRHSNPQQRHCRRSDYPCGPIGTEGCVRQSVDTHEWHQEKCGLVKYRANQAVMMRRRYRPAKTEHDQWRQDPGRPVRRNDVLEKCISRGEGNDGADHHPVACFGSGGVNWQANLLKAAYQLDGGTLDLPWAASRIGSATAPAFHPLRTRLTRHYKSP